MRSVILIILLGLIVKSNVLAQEILWVSEIEDVSGAFAASGDFSAEKVIGYPDALPQGELHANAFRLDSEAAFGSLFMRFSKPITVNFIVISENFEPGRITEIFLYDQNGGRTPVYKSEASKYFDDYRILVLNTSGSGVVSNKIEISINSAGDPGWSQIDAVAISDHVQSNKILEELTDNVFFHIREEMAFLEFKEKLGVNINTRYDETKPLISQDGNFLYFSRAFHPSNMGGKKDPQDILISTAEGDDWSLPDNPGPPLNNTHPNGVSSVSPDGNSLYLIDNYTNPGKEGGVAESQKSEIGWTVPRKIEIKNYKNRSDFEDYFISNDGRVMILALEDATSQGDLDLYISFYDVNISMWSEPINLGPKVNSAGPDFAPFLASDDRTLYYSSNGHPGYGSSDIFFTYRLDESWLNWIAPQNLGKNVNTSQTDAYYTVPAKGDYGYFISTAGGAANSRDIYRIKLTGAAKPDPVILVKGRVFNGGTNDPMSAKIQYKSADDNGEVLSSPKTGEYTIVLKAGKLYNVYGVEDGFISGTGQLDLRSVDNFEERNLDLTLLPVSVGSVIKLNSVRFERGTATLLDDSFGELDQWISILKENPQMEIELGGHTDNRGNYDANMKLSKDRVDVVKEYLVDNGIENRRLKTKGYGPTKPLNNNATEEKRAENRRVEITVLSF